MITAIIKDTDAYKDYPFEAIDEATLTAIKRAGDQLSKAHLKRLPGLLKCLECFLEITNQQLSYSEECINETIINLFTGALNSEKFIASSKATKYTMTRTWVTLLKQLKLESPNLVIPEIKASTTSIHPTLQRWINDFDTTALEVDKVILWKGWYSVNTNNKEIILPFYPIYKRLGKEFTQDFYRACDKYYSTRKNGIVPCLTPFTLFINQYPGSISSDSFQSRLFVGKFIKEFLIFYIKHGESKNTRLSTIATMWRGQFVSFFKEYLISPQLFAEPLGAFPSPLANFTKGSKTNIRVTEKGIEVKTKLLTHIPTHISDEVAMIQLLVEIKSDVDHIRNWAEWELENVWKRYQRRLAYASIGKVRLIQDVGVNSGDYQWLTDRKNPDYLKNAAATFAYHGYLTYNDITISSLYPVPLKTTAEELGLPTSNALLPHCALLVIEHPAITPSFLEGFKLFNDNNKLTGFVETDGGYKLVGYKPRRGSVLAQQTIILNQKSAEIVQQIIALTEPLRDYLRSKNDNDWRYLLLSCKSGFGEPMRCTKASHTRSHTGRANKIVTGLKKTSGMSYIDATNLVGRFSLVTLRASVGVLVYLDTLSTKKMAEALGHDSYIPKLIDRYLPQPILDFFQQRWIRIFQDGIIAEAMKDSTRLLEAINFKNMDELHEFLNNHALRTIPSHLITSEFDAITSSNSMPEINCKVIMGVNQGILTALLSLQKAVSIASRPVCQKANFWSCMSERLVKYIETDLSSRPDIQQHLKIAQINANADEFKEFIYEDY